MRNNSTCIRHSSPVNLIGLALITGSGNLCFFFTTSASTLAVPSRHTLTSNFYQQPNQKFLANWLGKILTNGILFAKVFPWQSFALYSDNNIVQYSYLWSDLTIPGFHAQLHVFRNTNFNYLLFIMSQEGIVLLACNSPQIYS